MYKKEKKILEFRLTSNEAKNAILDYIEKNRSEHEPDKTPLPRVWGNYMSGRKLKTVEKNPLTSYTDIRHTSGVKVVCVWASKNVEVNPVEKSKQSINEFIDLDDDYDDDDDDGE